MIKFAFAFERICVTKFAFDEWEFFPLRHNPRPGNVIALFSLFIAYSGWSVAMPTTPIPFGRLPSARRYGSRSSSDVRHPRPLVAMSSLASHEVAFRSMVASVVQPVQHDDELRLGAIVHHGRRSAVCWLAPCRRLAGID